jgi:hypothetical protein
LPDKTIRDVLKRANLGEDLLNRAERFLGEFQAQLKDPDYVVVHSNAFVEGLKKKGVILSGDQKEFEALFLEYVLDCFAKENPELPPELLDLLKRPYITRFQESFK